MFGDVLWGNLENVSIVFHKIGDHYNCVSFNSTEPLWDVGHDAHDYDIPVHEDDVKYTDMANENFNVHKATEEYHSNTPRDFLYILQNHRNSIPRISSLVVLISIVSEIILKQWNSFLKTDILIS